MSVDRGECLQVERRGAFWFARLNRPDKRNALSEPMLAALLQLCGQIESDAGARALVLWGAGGHFCAGADFGRFLELLSAPAAAGAGADPIVEHNRYFGTVLERLASLPVPTLGVVRGAAMGGGCGLAAVMDRVIATDDATFALPEVTLGVIPSQIAPFIARRAGTTRARWLMLSAARLDARAAADAGLADAVVSGSTLQDAVLEELRRLAAAEPSALRATRLLASRNLELPLGAALDAAALDFARQLRTGAAQEGIAASRERRAPAWSFAVTDLPEFA
jgi:isohexenylglutaconyl-CoA hydratase